MYGSHFFAPFHVTNKKSNYNVIFGQDLLRKFGLNLDFKMNFDCWKETKILMKPIDCNMRTNFVIQDSKNIKSTVNRIKKMLNAKYKTADLKEITT